MNRIAGYTYKADNYCRKHILEKMGVGPEDQIYDVDTILTALAKEQGIHDLLNLYSYDSDDFPKRFFSDQVDSSTECGSCGKTLR